MARFPRMDAPGSFHHVYNRAARRQVLFADQADYRYFVMLLACAVRRGELTIQGYCLMSTHFHLLTASPQGRISYAMMRMQNAYVRYRNRRSRLDGPLLRPTVTRLVRSFGPRATVARTGVPGRRTTAVCRGPGRVAHGRRIRAD